jgi:hypothetical protein
MKLQISEVRQTNQPSIYKTQQFSSKIVFTGLSLRKPLSVDTISFQNKTKPYTAKINKLADFRQLDDRLPYNGDSYCGPSSVSNAIMYLAANGYPALTAGKNQLEVVKELGKFLNTDEDGTTTENMCQGIEKYMTDKGYAPKKLEYQGLRKLSSYHTGVKKPDIDWIKKAIEKEGMVLLNIGWYKPRNNAGKVEYIREGGHWVLAAGHSTNGKAAHPDYLIVHDSMSDEMKKPSNYYLKLDKLNVGQLIAGSEDNEKGLPADAKGHYTISECMLNYTHDGSIPILDGVIAVEL